MDLKGRDFLKLLDFTPEEIEYLLDLAADLKDKKKKGIPVDTLRGKNVALIFEKTSTRTRCAFEVAAHDLGMGTTYLDPTGSQIGKKESIADTARVLAGMFEGIGYFMATISCVNSGRIPQHTAAPSAHAFSPIEPVTKCSPNVSAPSAQLPHGVLKISGTTRSSCARALAKSKLSSAKKPIRSAAETSGSSRSITSSTDKLWLTV